MPAHIAADTAFTPRRNGTSYDTCELIIDRYRAPWLDPAAAEINTGKSTANSADEMRNEW